MAIAATDGALSASSTGTSDISVSIPPLIKLSGVEDIDLGVWTNGTEGLADGVDICIYTNTPSGLYQVTVTGDGAGGAFELKNQDEQVLPFAFRWNDQSGSLGAVAVSPGQALSAQSGANTSAQNCGGGSNAHMQAEIGPSVLHSAGSGSYSGQVHVLVEPD